MKGVAKRRRQTTTPRMARMCRARASMKGVAKKRRQIVNPNLPGHYVFVPQ